MRIGLITYQVGHRKTLDIALKLLAKGRTCTLFAFPFVKREPLKLKPRSIGASSLIAEEINRERYQERPSQIMEFDVEAFCKRYGFGYRKMLGWEPGHAATFADMDVWLHCTAKIVPPAFIGHRMILNAHPGMLPRNRGVDAFKWAIVNNWPIGVTLHMIDEEIDRGTILYRHVVPLLSDDTLASVCERAYRFECDMLANFADHISALDDNWRVGDDHPVNHKRIPAQFDAMLPELFARKREVLMTAE